MKKVKVKSPRPPKGTCGKRPNLDQSTYNPMAPACTFAPRHEGPHSWETKEWQISERIK